MSRVQAMRLPSIPSGAVRRGLGGTARDAVLLLLCTATFIPVARADDATTRRIAPVSQAPAAGTGAPPVTGASPVPGGNGPDMSTGDSPELRLPATPSAAVEPLGNGMPKGDDKTPRGTTTNLRLRGLIDREVHGPDHASLGRIIDVLTGPEGDIQAVVVDVGGFLGVGNRRVAIAWPLFAPDKSDPKDAVTAMVPSEAIRSAPEYKQDTLDVQVLTGPRVAPPEPPPPTTAPPPVRSGDGATAVVPVQPLKQPDAPESKNSPASQQAPSAAKVEPPAGMHDAPR